MREDLMCEVKGRVVDAKGSPLVGRPVELLPGRPYFVLDGQYLCPLGSRQLTDANGEFSMLLTRSDLTGVQYLTGGSLGRYRVTLTGPGPHVVSRLIKDGEKYAPRSH